MIPEYLTDFFQAFKQCLGALNWTGVLILFCYNLGVGADPQGGVLIEQKKLNRRNTVFVSRWMNHFKLQ